MGKRFNDCLKIKKYAGGKGQFFNPDENYCKNNCNFKDCGFYKR